jgi:hypothetical protein
MNDLKVTDKRAPHIGDENLPVEIESKDAVIMYAMKKGYSPELIEKMMDLQERHERREAEKAFHKAMAKFKANPPKVLRDLQVKYEIQGKTPTSWSHSDLGVAGEAIGKGLGECQLNHTWRTKQEPGKIEITCVIAHELGHSESTALFSAPDKTGSKNDIQALGSAIFYLERYTLFALTGIAPARMDDDGNATSGPVEYINDQQYGSIIDMMNHVEADEEKFLQYLKIESIEKMPLNKFNMAVKALEAKLAKKGL